MVLFTTFVNARILRDGQEHEAQQLVASPETGRFLKRTGYIGGDIVDLEDALISPGLLDLQTNGSLGFHFTDFKGPEAYDQELHRVARGLVKTGVTAFWVTLPTVQADLYKKILPHLRPRSFPDGARLLGAHVEGPYLHPSKAGAHNPEFFKLPNEISPEDLYGEENLRSSIKLVTLAPELPGSLELVAKLKGYGCRVALGHSAASYEQGMEALKQGATCITHLFNAMNPIHHRVPGLAGLAGSDGGPFYSIITDGLHLHPATVSLAYRVNPNRTLVITDSVELAGLPDGTYPGHAQIARRQTKIGDKVVIEGTDTLIGGCASLDTCVANLEKWTGCSRALAVKCATENIAEMMGAVDVGTLKEGRYADFVVWDEDRQVSETWVGGVQVWSREG